MTATDQLLDPILADLPVPAETVGIVELPDAAPARAQAELASARRSAVLAIVPGSPGDEMLARLRDALWPEVHLSAIYRIGADGTIQRTALSGRQPLGECAPGEPRTVLLLLPRQDALGRQTTQKKFDAHAVGWNGSPGTPTYPHYRWMRRLLALVARPARGARALDAGCGTGWVGIEAGRLGAMASAFDPSPAMVELARENARQVGVDLDARVGFVEDVPFEHSFDLVLNSGVISFAPDTDVFLDRLDHLVAPGGQLVIGDLNPHSRGFRRRRRKHPLLPARELNGVPRDEIERRLIERGYTIETRHYYQLTFPVPQLMALSERSGRGFGCGLLLLLNRLACSLDTATGSPMRGLFDSWIVKARKRT